MNQSNQMAYEGSKTPTPWAGTDENKVSPMTLSVDHRCDISSSS